MCFECEFSFIGEDPNRADKLRQSFMIETRKGHLK